MATLTTTVQESVTINGKSYGNTIEKTHSSIEQVYQQVVNVDTSVQELFGFAASEKAGDVAIDKAKYIRFTNLGANFVTIYFSSDSATGSVEDIAVLQAQYEANRLAYDREMKELKETVKAIFNKLDSIEQALRDK